MIFILKKIEGALEPGSQKHFLLFMLQDSYFGKKKHRELFVKAFVSRVGFLFPLSIIFS
jgi:hypothetical protein